MQTDAVQSEVVVSGHGPKGPRHPVVQAVADVVRPHASKLDQVAARGRLREALMSYVRTLRADGATPSDVFTRINALVRHALAGTAPARMTADIRDTIRRWTLAAYDRAD